MKAFYLILFSVLHVPALAMSYMLPLSGVLDVAAISSFALGRSLGSDASLSCPGERRKFSCCSRIFNTTLHEVINGACVGDPSSEVPKCDDHTSVTCVGESGELTTPSVGSSSGLVYGVESAALFWSFAHLLLASAWWTRNTDEIPKDQILVPRVFKDGHHCTKQGWLIFKRYFLSAATLTSDLIAIIYGFGGQVYPKIPICSEGMSCCSESGCRTSLSALAPTCRMNEQVQCVSGESLQDPSLHYTTTALTLGVTGAITLGFSTIYALFLRYYEHKSQLETLDNSSFLSQVGP